MPFIQKISAAFLRNRFGVPKYMRPPQSWIPNFSTQEFEKYLEQIAEDNAQEFLELLLENIKSNKFGYRLKEATIRAKGSNIPWIETSELTDNLVRDGDTVRFKRGRHNSGLKYEDLAVILEYGLKDRGIPPRPVFRETFREFQKKAKQNIIKALK